MGEPSSGWIFQSQSTVLDQLSSPEQVGGAQGAQYNREVLMIRVNVSENVIQTILDFYAKNNETDYQRAKDCQDHHEKDMTAAQREVVHEAKARCLTSMKNPRRFL